MIDPKPLCIVVLEIKSVNVEISSAKLFGNDKLFQLARCEKIGTHSQNWNDALNLLFQKKNSPILIFLR